MPPFALKRMARKYLLSLYSVKKGSLAWLGNGTVLAGDILGLSRVIIVYTKAVPFALCAHYLGKPSTLLSHLSQMELYGPEAIIPHRLDLMIPRGVWQAEEVYYRVNFPGRLKGGAMMEGFCYSLVQISGEQEKWNLG